MAVVEQGTIRLITGRTKWVVGRNYVAVFWRWL